MRVSIQRGEADWHRSEIDKHWSCIRFNMTDKRKDISDSGVLSADFARPVCDAGEAFTFEVLERASARLCTGRTVRSSGRRIVAKVSECQEPEKCVRLNLDQAMVLGVIAASWHDGLSAYVAIELQEALSWIDCQYFAPLAVSMARRRALLAQNLGSVRDPPGSAFRNHHLTCASKCRNGWSTW